MRKIIFIIVSALSLSAYAQSNLVWKKSVTYYANDMGSCNSSSTSVCLTAQQNAQACKAAKGITELASGILSNGADYDAGVLMRRGNIDRISLSWNAARNSCIVSVATSGVVNGNSKRYVVEGRAVSYAVTNDNKLLVSQATSY